MKALLNYLLNKHWILRIAMCFLNEGKKEQIYIARFRAELAFEGHDVSDMTDEEIKDRVNKMGEMVAKCGMTTKEVENVSRALAKYAHYVCSSEQAHQNGYVNMPKPKQNENKTGNND